MSKSEIACPRCGGTGLKDWKELDRDERIVIDRLPGSAEFTPEERERHRFCTRCWFESVGNEDRA